MHMLEAGINLVWIRDFLGHSSTTTTEVYARASSKMKEEALAKLDPGILKKGKSSWQDNKELLFYRKNPIVRIGLGALNISVWRVCSHIVYPVHII